ncbi:hypothetical protein ASPNIDRAFT_134002 [Aspergillus niger ATCC 1015]|uniref:Major facilitator superfamily (MFS) profile domain-containing protein n=1 Tax=Aspergillus niger (strain ATCC 1015 / CBS 113.46 / FGSC A1144 / LSHB Ac4 / NCTC 3858a / NRRL 328 / USDA 3528.7) TaxID=380704 RepID=G3XT08_ASPNA|nr:hypothetical protein ASPNIDRAFT_134002 [Aspergillus niger ATCC 1015]
MADDSDYKLKCDASLSEEIENVITSPFSPEEEKALVRKVDLTLLPTIWIMYLLSYMDRTNIGNAKISGMQADLDLTSGQYSIALVVFFIGYVVFEVPSNLVLSHTRPSLFLTGIMVIWGALTCVMGVIKDYKHLVVLRALIGCVEAGFAPGVLLVLSSWYKRTEQSKRFGVYISAAILSGAFGSLLAAATSKRLSERERYVAITRLATDNVTSLTEDSPELSHWHAVVESAKDWRTWGFVIGYMVIVGSSTLSYFYPTLVEGLFGDSSTERVNFLTVPIYAVAFVCTAITAYFSDRIPQWRGLVIAGWLSASLACSSAVCVVYNYTARYVLLVLMAAGLWATNGGTLAYASSAFANMHPQVRGVSLALVNALGNLAQIYGSYLFPSSDGPKYIMGFSVISAMLALGVIVFLVIHVWFRRRAAAIGQA